MSEQPYMKLWIADFLGDTLHLSDAEIGQYMLLLMAMWRNGGVLPDDPAKLARVARNTISPAVMAFFVRNANAMLTQKRLACEVENAKAKSEKAKNSAGVRWLKNKKTSHANAYANAMQSHSHSQLETIVSNNKQNEPLEILQTVLNSETAEAVIEHRKRAKQPLNLIAARRLAAQLAKWPDPNEAAAEMMLRNWRGFKPEWMQSDRRNGPDPPAQTRTALAGEKLLGEIRNGKFGPGIRDTSGADAVAQLPEPTARPGYLPAPVDIGLRRQAKNSASEDG